MEQRTLHAHSRPPPMYPHFYGGVKSVQRSISGAHLLTPPATPGGPRPFAQLTCNLLRRLWAPDLGVQACGPAPLTARHARGPHQARRVSWAAGTKAYGCTSPEGAEGTGAAAGHARRKERDAPRLNRGVHRGFAPYARSLGTFSGARESTPPVGAGPDKPQDLPEPSGKRTGFWFLSGGAERNSPSGETEDALSGRDPTNQRICRNLPAKERAFGSFRAVPKGTRPQAKPRRRKVRFASFLPKDGENSTRSLAPPLPTETADAGFRRGPR